MNEKLEMFKQNIKGKSIGIIGIGKSNLPATLYLLNMGAKITVCDKRSVIDNFDISQLEARGVSFELGENYLKGLNEFDYILRSPGVKPFTPEIEKAVIGGSVLTSEVELLIDLAPCKIIGITGSDGKTTTTTLTAKFLEECGKKVWIGGNIGIPLFDKLDEMKPDDYIVLELSSFQLMTLRKSPEISIVTNISPNHLDYHRSYEEYIDAKANIFMYPSVSSPTVILNADDLTSKYYLDLMLKNNIHANIRYFSLKGNVKNGMFLDGNNVYESISSVEPEIVCNRDNIQLAGIHNIANICAAGAAVIDITGTKAVVDVISSFKGVKHRMELIHEENGVKWYNDSIGTSPSRTMAGLNSFSQKIILIAGGYDKHIPYDVIGEPILDKVKSLVLVGATASKIEEAVRNAAKKRGTQISSMLQINNFNTLDECVKFCYKESNPGDIIIMSPASASFDLYKNFEERGEHFVSLVKRIYKKD